MDADEASSYALLRIVPSLERGEALNAGIVLYCRRAKFLAMRWQIPDAALKALAPDLDLEPVRANLTALERIAAGDESAGPVAAQEPSERFHWLVAPASTTLQPGPVHTGLTGNPEETLARLFSDLIA